MSTALPSGRSAVLRQNRASRSQRLLRAVRTPGGAVFILLISLLTAIIVLNPSFGEPGSFIRFIGRTAPIAIAAVGQYFVIVSGEFDLSMGSVVTMQVIVAGNLIRQDDSRVIPVLILMFVLGAFIGLVNGLISTLLKVPSFIVTLGMMLALLGLVLYWTGGAAQGNPADSFRQIGRGGIQDVPVLDIIPYPVIILTAVAILAVALMRRPFGRMLIAVGDNPRAAELAGSRVWWVRTRAFIISSLSATVAGDPARGLRGSTSVGGAGLRVHGDHRRRPRWRSAGRRTWLGPVRGGRSVRTRVAVYPPEFHGCPGHLAGHGPRGNHHHRCGSSVQVMAAQAQGSHFRCP